MYLCLCQISLIIQIHFMLSCSDINVWAKQPYLLWMSAVNKFFVVLYFSSNVYGKRRLKINCSSYETNISAHASDIMFSLCKFDRMLTLYMLLQISYEAITISICFSVSKMI